MLATLDWSREDVDGWDDGRIWRAPTGEYIVVEHSPDTSGPLNRLHAGVNHLALVAESRSHLDDMRSECAAHGWRELFPGKYPHAGGPNSYALYIVNTEGFEVEVVAE